MSRADDGLAVGRFSGLVIGETFRGFPFCGGRHLGGNSRRQAQDAPTPEKCATIETEG